MRGMMRLALLGVPGAQGGLRLPLAFDFSTMPDGALPSLLKGTTWSISSGKAINTPALGPNLLTDPGLEATYTSGLCDTLTKFGSPVVAESADAHEGSRAQQFTATAAFDRLRYPTVNGAANTWYQFSAWGKRTAGSTSTTQANVTATGSIPPASTDAYVNAAYQQVKTSVVLTGANALSCFPLYQSSMVGGANTVIADDGALNAITHGSLFALAPATHANVIVKAQPGVLPDGTSFGLALRANAQTDPNSAILVGMYRQTNDFLWSYIYVIKLVAGAYSSVLAQVGTVIAANAYLEARVNGSTLKVYYNNAQVGGDLTISDAELASGNHHGIWSTGDTAFKQLIITEA